MGDLHGNKWVVRAVGWMVVMLWKCWSYWSWQFNFQNLPKIRAAHTLTLHKFLIILCLLLHNFFTRFLK